jgi:adenylyltransferase/sulfurtransferase
VPPCQEAGVLSVVAGVVGSLQAAETLKVILGLGDPLVGRLLFYRAQDGSFMTVRYSKDPACSHHQKGTGTIS